MTTRKTRRTFARELLILGGGLGAFGGGLAGALRLARASDTPNANRHYVFAYFSGGWDVLLSLDPRDPAEFPEESLGEHRIMPGYNRLQGSDGALITAGGLTFGPYIGGLVDHVDRLAVIRGMSMETLTHEVGRRRFLTGRRPAGLQARGSSGATWLASRLGAENPVPHIAVAVEAYNADQPAYASATRVQNANDLVRLLRAGTHAVDEVQDALLQSFLESEAECDRARHSRIDRAAETTRVRMHRMLDADLASHFDLDASSISMLKEEFAVPARDYASPEAQALIAFQALTNRISRVVSIEATSQLDTHFTEWSREQGPRQKRGFDVVARLATHLANTPYGDVPGTSWLDHTTIVGFSEFMRSPLINDRGGRDHWLTNSCFLLGGNVRPGVIGASSNVGMEPQPVALASGAVSSAGEIILPEHIIRTLIADAGFETDIAELGVAPIPALLRS